MTVNRVQSLASKIQKLQAYHDLQNQMGRLIVAVNFHQPARVLDFLALDNPDVWIEYADEGVFRGREAVEALVEASMGGQPRPGEMVDMQLTTPIIEVADDLLSARGLWWCPGAGALAGEDGDPEAIWIWGMVTADLIPVNGTWKVLHLHYFRYIKCSYAKGWTEDTSMINRPNKPMHPLSSPGTYHNPYSPLSVRDGLPAAPRPYAAYDGPSWMLERDKAR